MYIQHSLSYAVLHFHLNTFSFKLANISGSYDRCSRGPRFIGTQCR